MTANMTMTVSDRMCDLFVVDIRLRSVVDSDDAELHRHDASTQHVHRVSAVVHQVQLC